MKDNTYIKEQLNRFSIPQMLSNTDGKTSSSAVVGVIISLIGGICFFIGSIYFMQVKLPDVMIYSTGVITIGVGLLGYRKSKENSTELTITETNTNKEAV